MTCRWITALMICGLASHAAADPTVSVAGVANGGNIDWTVAFAPDDSLFSTTVNGTGGSLAVEYAIEFDGEIDFSSIAVDPQFMESIEETTIVNPGNDPYTGTVSMGLQQYDEEASALGGSGPVDAIFAPLGSTFFTNGGDKLALSFTTLGTSGTLSFGGLIAQAGLPFTIPVDQVSIVPTFEPLAGDADNDGFVKGSDLLAVTNNFGSVGPTDGLLLGDADDDGFVKGSDLLAVTNNFGNTLPSFELAAAPVETLVFGDADHDGYIKGSDLLAVTNNFGNTGPADSLLLGDADVDGAVTGADLLAVINNFGGTFVGAGAAGIPGDFNFDGFVHPDDYTIWRDNNTATGAGLLADADFNDRVDIADYQIWRDNYGAGAALTSADSAVPEPRSIATVVLATAMLLGRRHRS